MQQDLRQASATQPSTTQPSATQPAPNPAIEAALGPYKVGPSDVLGVVVTTGDEAGPVLPVQVRIDRNGQIELPMVGKVRVTDLELEDVEQAIRAAYVPKFYRQAAVHVELISVELTNVLVVGAVTQPGLVQLRRTERDLLRAIVGAGGVSELASGKVTLRRLRRPSEEVTLSLVDPEQLRAALVLDPLEEGDILTVHAATPNVIFVGGLVNAPRPQTYPPGVDITILQAIAGSGGLRTDVTPREATLIRRMPNGQDIHVKLDLDRITTSKDPNIKLAAGDILWVPDTLETRIQDWVNRNIYIRAGVSANVNYNVTGIDFLNDNARQQTLRGAGGTLQDTFDPFGFLNRNVALQALQNIPPPTP